MLLRCFAYADAACHYLPEGYYVAMRMLLRLMLCAAMPRCLML